MRSILFETSIVVHFSGWGQLLQCTPYYVTGKRFGETQTSGYPNSILRPQLFTLPKCARTSRKVSTRWLQFESIILRPYSIHVRDSSLARLFHLTRKRARGCTISKSESIRRWRWFLISHVHASAASHDKLHIISTDRKATITTP